MMENQIKMMENRILIIKYFDFFVLKLTMEYSACFMISLDNIPNNLKQLKYDDMNDLLMDKYILKFKESFDKLAEKQPERENTIIYKLMKSVESIDSNTEINIRSKIKDDIYKFTSVCCTPLGNIQNLHLEYIFSITI